MPSTGHGGRARMCALILSAILLASCRTTDSAATTDAVRAACAAFAPIWWSRHDTAKTVAQVKEHNAAWRAYCRGSGR